MLKPNIFSDFYLKSLHKILHCQHPREAFIQYKNFRIDLLTAQRSNIPVGDLLDKMNDYDLLQQYQHPIVIHLFYEFGFYCQGLESLCRDHTPLAIFIYYEEAQIEVIPQIKKECYDFVPLEHQSWHQYREQFKKVYRHLCYGDCYQLNLTQPFYFRALGAVQPRKLIQSIWNESLKVGAYAHGTFIGGIDTFYFSNSPECLFQVSEGKLRTMPIKGTALVNDETKRAEVWQKLLNSQKDGAELDMITDLMRNDLTKISMRPAMVLHKRYPLHVPGLVHQFSVIESKLNETSTLKDIILALFPGGSITGAPKKKVMELISQIENHHRGFYCGSTVLLYKNTKTASINIRSATFNFEKDEIHYGAGGGITLLSKDLAEYQECFNKLKSFLLLFK